MCASCVSFTNNRLQTSLNPAVYDVKIFTTEASKDRFFYTFVGTKGESQTFDASGNRVSGESYTWTFKEYLDIGRFKCLKIKKYGTDDWSFEDVRKYLNL